MTTPLTKAALRSLLELETDAALADFFGISRSAVAQWPEDGPIPELRQLQAERARPDLFGLDASGIHRPGAAAEGSSAAQPSDDMSEAA